ncbi:UbiD family decarboxylase [Colletotrichum tofieldiae]|uniref:UbiD family decarboxylase n=1 Tax=Colletotrichum tofieldiae TaxID=708197 RepID=A0A166ZE14_9PEZI|nr:UbiD family decarboxylase [Colletotrichum tofieldiae]
MYMPKSARVECWYTIRKRNFIRDVPVEDMLMAVTVIVYTTAIVALYLYFETASSFDFSIITPEEEPIIGRQLGILNILGETAIQTTLWGNKCCLLLLYKRLTYVTPLSYFLGYPSRLFRVKENSKIYSLLGHQYRVWVMVATYTGLSYVAVICLSHKTVRILSEERNYQHFTYFKECLTWFNYNILQMTMNLSTDLVLLLIPVTLISRLNMKIGKKLLLICLFSMGVFIMLSAILLKVAVFTNTVDPVWLIWCIREISTAMLVGNLVLCMPIFKAWWRFLFRSSNTLNNDSLASGNVARKRFTRDSQSGGGGTTTTSESGLSRWDSTKRTRRLTINQGRILDVESHEQQDEHNTMPASQQRG